MTIKTPNHSRRWRQLPVVWQDSAWFPTVGRLHRLPARPVTWPAPVVVDTTGCLERTPSPIKL